MKTPFPLILVLINWAIASAGCIHGTTGPLGAPFRGGSHLEQLHLTQMSEVVGAYENVAKTKYDPRYAFRVTQTLAGRPLLGSNLPTASPGKEENIQPRRSDMTISQEGMVTWISGRFETDIDAPPGKEWWVDWERSEQCVIRDGAIYCASTDSKGPLFVAFRTRDDGLVLVPGDEVADFLKVAPDFRSYVINVFVHH